MQMYMYTYICIHLHIYVNFQRTVHLLDEKALVSKKLQ